MVFVLDEVSYIYDKGGAYQSQALDRVSLTVGDGEFIGLIGHTGSGKSTLIQLMDALLKPDSGTIYYNGEDINGSSYDRRKLRSEVGLVFQYPEHQLFEESVFKDVCFGPKNLGLSQKEQELRAYRALELTGLSKECFYQSPFDLSGGQKRRAAIAGVLSMEPKVFILDEPTAGLDPKGRKEILNLIRDLREKTGMTVILVSHSMDDVADYADRIIAMDKGRVFLDGTPKEVFAHAEELAEAGLSVPEVTAIVRMIADRGLPVDTSVTTIPEARDEILRILGR
ncbi:MAG: energy-coupling factor transporter ATPase [Lachnospiraceae bacterium]|nr:energy-coupling factor transporter ATPase [Lachnospiraceae bacterium]